MSHVEYDTISIHGAGEFRVVPATNHEGCVDPRNRVEIEDDGNIHHRLNEEPGEMRSAGASAGHVMALLGANPNLSVTKAVLLVASWADFEGRQFTTHNLIEEDCGHVSKASKPEHERLYGLDSSRVRDMRHAIIDLSQIEDFVVEDPILTGAHQEAGALIVHSQMATIIPNNGTAAYFRLDDTRHTEGLERLADFARREKVIVTADQLKATANHQAKATLGLLAPGLPMYAVHLGDSQPRSEYLGKIKPATRLHH